VSLEPAQPGEALAGGSGGETLAEEAAVDAVPAGPERDGDGDAVQTPAPTRDDARVAGIGEDDPAAEATAAGGHQGDTDSASGTPAASMPPEVALLAAAVADLDDLGELPVPEHVARYDAVHGQLSEALASIDEV
jgi:hypothetical protein